MKVSVFTCLFVVFTFMLHSQTQKRAWLLNGNAALTSSIGEQPNGFGLNLAPSAGYFFSDRLLAGSSLSYSYSSLGEILDNSAFEVTPFLRYYFSSTEQPMVWFVTAGYSVYRSKLDFGATESKTNSTFFFGGIGLNYFLNANAAIESNLHFQQNYNEISDASSLIFNTSLQFFLSSTISKSTTAIAIQQGGSLIGLNAGGGWRNIGTTDDWSLSVNPKLGFFITDRWALGSGLLLGFADENAIVEPQPFARYYFGKSTLALQPFATAQLHTRLQFADQWKDASFFNLDALVGLGLDYFLTPDVALEGLLGLNSSELEDQSNRQTYLNFQIGLQFFLLHKEAR